MPVAFIISLFLCVSGSFQALIQYSDMLSAQTAKFVSIHLTLLSSLLPSGPLLFIPRFRHRCARSSPPPLSLSSFLFFLSFFYFLIQAYPCHSAGMVLIRRAPAGQIEIFRGNVSRWKNIFRSAIKKAALRRLIAGHEPDERNRKIDGKRK